MDVQFASSGLEVNIAERLKTPDFRIRKIDKNTAIAGETFEVGMALFIQIGAHPLDLKISHITYAPAKRAFVRTRAAKLKSLYQTPLRQHLTGRTYDLAETPRCRKHADNMRAPGNPDNRFVFARYYVPLGVYLK
jgi:hypothetical protein